MSRKLEEVEVDRCDVCNIQISGAIKCRQCGRDLCGFHALALIVRGGVDDGDYINLTIQGQMSVFECLLCQNCVDTLLSSLKDEPSPPLA